MIRLALEVMTKEVQLVWLRTRGDATRMRLTEVLALHETVRKCPADTLSCLFFVPVVAGTVEKTVAGLDGIINRLEWTLGTVATLQMDENTRLRK